MTYQEQSQFLTKTRIRLEGLVVSVKVLDIRQVFNRVDALIQVAGDDNGASRWVDAGRLFK